MRLPILLLTLALANTAPAEIARRAPDFAWPGAGNRSRTLKSLRGQPVVLVIAESPRTGAFRKQLKWLKQTYSELAAKGTVFIAAFRQGDGPVQSDIPFVVARDGAAVASAYEIAGDFGLAIIGRDGNLDYVTNEVRTGERVRDVVINNFVPQTASRK